MKKLLALGGLLLGVSPVMAQEKPFFPDVPRDHWAFNAVQRLAKEGILNGYPAETTTPAPVLSPAPQSKPTPLENAVTLTPRIKTALGATQGLQGRSIVVDTLVTQKQVILSGTVNSQSQKTLAGVAARKHSGTFKVVNNLRVQK